MATVTAAASSLRDEVVTASAYELRKRSYHRHKHLKLDFNLFVELSVIFKSFCLHYDFKCF